MISLFGLKFGMAIYLLMSLHSLASFIFCKIFNVRVMKIHLLSGELKSRLFKREINGTVFSLGWFPFSNGIMPLGTPIEDESIDPLQLDEMPYALKHKPKYQQFIIKVAPYLAWGIVLVALVHYINPLADYQSNLAFASEYISKILQALFGSLSTDDFATYSKNATAGLSFYPFSLLILTVYFMIVNCILMLGELAGNSRNKALKLFKFVLILIACYIALWKIPVFLYQFYNLSQLATYSFSAVIGIYLMALASFAVISVLSSLASKNS